LTKSAFKKNITVLTFFTRLISLFLANLIWKMLCAHLVLAEIDLSRNVWRFSFSLRKKRKSGPDFAEVVAKKAGLDESLFFEQWLLGGKLSCCFKEALGDILLEVDENEAGRPVGVLEFKCWGRNVGSNCSFKFQAGICFETGVKLST